MMAFWNEPVSTLSDCRAILRAWMRGDVMTNFPMFNPFMAGLNGWQELTKMQLGMVQAAADQFRTTTPITAFSTGDISVYFPFGRDYHQTIEPNTNWGLIRNSQTDHPDVEKEIVRDVASYGMQLGRILDLIVDMGDQLRGVDPEALSEVKKLKARIDGVKSKHGLTVD